MRKPSICMVSDHGCVRVFKEASVLLRAGYLVHLVCRDVPFGWNRFTTVSVFSDERQLSDTVRSSSADIFHVHNEPDWLVYRTKEAAPRNKPVIFDVHDLQCLRVGGEVQEDEKKAFEAADACIFVSKAALAFSKVKHGNGKPMSIIYSYMNEEFIPDKLPASSNFESIVYEGGIGKAQDTVEQNGIQFHNYRDYLPIARVAIDQDFLFTIFPANPVSDYRYENAGVSMMKSLPYPVLLHALRAHGLGIVGSYYDILIMQAAMPNKLFEYMSQGVVPVVINAAEAAAFVEKNECGIVLSSFDNLREQLSDAPRIRNRVLDIRKEFTMESQLKTLTDLYDEVL